MVDRVKYTFSGHSLVMNALFVLINLAAVTFITLAFQEAFSAKKWLFVTIGAGMLILSTVGIVIFKGRMMMAYVSRVLVGSIFIVSGLIKANDPLGFSYKLEEYFEDGALAFRIKDWFSSPQFSLESLIPYALEFSVIICIIEILVGVLVLIGGKIKLTSWLLLLMIVFFTFLTGHTATCDPNQKFMDRDVYPASSEIAHTKIEEAKTNKDVRIVSKKDGKVTVDEVKGTQCVLDCGCFGDAMKGSMGRSMSPTESFWKDLVLLYFIVWIFITQARIKPNTSRENSVIIPISLLLILFLSWVFDWYFPGIFALIALVGAVWIKQSGGKILGNYFGSTLFLIVLCTIFSTYVLMYEPMRDYRPYAVGSNLIEKMHDGIPSVYKNMFRLKNLKTGEIMTLSEKEYMDPVKKVWTDSTLKYVDMQSVEVKKGKLPSIDSSQFDPMLSVDQLTPTEKAMPYVDSILDANLIDGVLLKEVANNQELTIPKAEYDTTSYPTSQYTLVRPVGIINPELSEVSVRNLIVDSRLAMVIFSRNLNDANWEYVDKLKDIYAHCKKTKTPFVMVTSSPTNDIEKFRKKYHFDVPTFIMDFVEIKVVTRSNPTLMIVMNGVVKAKYPSRSIPSYDWIQKHILFKNIK